MAVYAKTGAQISTSVRIEAIVLSMQAIMIRKHYCLIFYPHSLYN